MINNMLPVYKDLISTYEESRQLHEKIIEEYNNASDTKPIVQCSKVVAYNDVGVITKWALILLNGLNIYQSGRYTANKTCIIELGDIALLPGTQFELKSLAIAAPDSTSTVILEYVPESNATTYFSLVGEALANHLKYLGVV